MENDANPGTKGIDVLFREGLPEQKDFPFKGPIQAHDAFRERRFPGTVVADDAHIAAFFHRKAKIAKDVFAFFVRKGKMLDREDGFTHGNPP